MCDVVYENVQYNLSDTSQKYLTVYKNDWLLETSLPLKYALTN
jgi:hypothetical protein